ncbi:ligand-binding sensor domain-containing protein [Ekhidna sp.]|uniref:ligand-binding sensor domain-containing protein n=1 Tax=Ekhidna sp. TaxID=2608089 RepID=UPI003B50A55B
MHQLLKSISGSLFWLHVLTFLSTYGQEYRPNIQHVSARSGLSQNTTTQIIQDKEGFLWIGTQDGLNKFDGYDFKIYRTNENDSTTLTNNYIKTIEIDKYDNIWLGTQIGLTKYNTKTGRFTRFLMDQDSLLIDLRRVVNDLLIDGDRIYIGTESGLLVADDIKKPRFTLDPIFPGDAHIRAIVKDDRGFIWIGTDDGELFIYKASDDKFYQINILNQESKQAIQCMSYFDGNIWIGTTEGVRALKIDNINFNEEKTSISLKAIKYPSPLNYFDIQSIFQDSKGQLWIGTHMEGVYILDPDKMSFTRMKSNGEESLIAFESITVGEIFEDKDKNIWIGTQETGLFKIRQSGKKFGLLRSNPGQSSLTSNRIRGLMKRGQIIWIGTSKGVTLFDRTNMTYQSLQNQLINNSSLSSNDIKAITTDQLNNVWIGTNDGLNRVQMPAFSLNTYYADDTNPDALILENRVRSIASLSDGNIWVGTLGGGVSVIDPKTLASVAHYFHNPKDTTSISSNNVMNIFEDSDKNIWASTYGGGLNRLVKGTTDWEKVKETNEAEFPLLLTTISEDKQGFLWVGTYGNGIIRLDRNDLSYKIFSKKDGLSNNVTYASIPTNQHVWISTNYGINRYDLSSQEFTTYNVNDGLQSNEFNSNSYLLCQSGEIFFGGVNGLTFFYPDSIIDNTSVPDLAFTELEIFNRPVSPNEKVMGGEAPINGLIRDSSKITLSHFHNVFTVGFTALDFISPEDIKYAYRLEGFEEEWIYTNSEVRNATYTNLKPGDYVFQVKASNNDGIWLDKPISLFIRVKPSIWQTWWFRFLVGALISAVIGLLIYRRINKVEIRKKFLESKIQEHTKEISEQNLQLMKSSEHLKNLNRKKDQMFYLLAHNVRAPLTTLKALFNHFRPESRTDDNGFGEYLDELNQNVTETIQLLDNTFYWSKLQFEDLYLHQEYFNISDLVDSAVGKYKKELSNKKLTMDINVIAHDIIGDPKMLTVILLNLIRNAIKYSYPNSQIKINGVEDQNRILLSIEDYGVGLSDEEIKSLFDEDRNINKLGTLEEKGTGLGLLLSYKIAQKLGYLLKVESEPSLTRFTIEIPL